MRIAIIGLLLSLTHIFETTIFQHIRIGGISPNFMIMIVVSFALLRGHKEGALIGCVAGLFYDVTFGAGIGYMTVAYGLVGYACGKLNKNFYRENFILPFLCTIASSLFISLTTTLRFIMYGKINFLFYFQTIIIPELIYTITLSLVVYQITYMINEKLELREKKTRNIF